MTRHMTLEDMTADCKQLSNIKALQRRHADRLHHKQKYMATTCVVQQGQEAGSSSTSHWARHCGWLRTEIEEHWNVLTKQVCWRLCNNTLKVVSIVTARKTNRSLRQKNQLSGEMANDAICFLVSPIICNTRGHSLPAKEALMFSCRLAVRAWLSKIFHMQWVSVKSL